MTSAKPRLDELDAVIFDMDGVVTDTAVVHAAAWKRLFDEYLQERAETEGHEFVPFDDHSDYERHVDGKNRYDGVRSFLESRGISLAEGDPDDPAGVDSVKALGNRKDEYFLEHIRAKGVVVYDSTVTLIRRLLDKGTRTAVVTASRNASEVLSASGLTGLFEEKVDGVVAAELGLPGKPRPDTFLEAARRLGVDPGRAAVVEDALSGVAAGRAGNFGLVVGVARRGQIQALMEAGADVVVEDLAELDDDSA